jgi:hypothetical protein
MNCLARLLIFVTSSLLTAQKVIPARPNFFGPVPVGQTSPHILR